MPDLHALNTNEPPQFGNEQRLILALCLASIVVYINLYAVQGMLPSIAEHFHVTGAKATLILSVTSFSLAFSLLMYAVISDRVGRLAPIMVSLWLLVASNILLIFAQDFDSLLLVRLLQGVLLAAVPAIAMAYFKDQLPANFLLKAAGIYIMANSLGGIGGRLMGGLLSQYCTWEQAMTVNFAVTLIGISIVSYLLPRREVKSEKIQQSTNVFAKIKQDVGGFIYHLTDPQMRLVYAIGGLAFMMMVNQFSFIQLHLMADPYNFSRFAATLIFLCYLSGTLTSYLSAKWVVKFGALRLFKGALVVMLLGTLLTLMDSLFTITIGFLLTASGFFLTHSCCNSFVAIRASTHRAKATSLYLCSYYLGASLGGPYLMIFWHQLEWQGVVIGSIGLLTLLFVAIMRLNFHQSKASELDLKIQTQ